MPSFFQKNTRATASLLNSYKIPTYALKTGELLHYQISLISLEALIICISQSEKKLRSNQTNKKDTKRKNKRSRKSGILE